MAKKVIIIDDDEAVQGVLRDFFEGKGFVVRAGSDGESGLELIKKERPDLVLVDILMPKKDGVVLCEALRGDPEQKNIQIILMTGVYRDFDFRIFLQKTLVDDFITKPIRLDELAAKIARLL